MPMRTGWLNRETRKTKATTPPAVRSAPGRSIPSAPVPSTTPTTTTTAVASPSAVSERKKDADWGRSTENWASRTAPIRPT